MDLPLKLEVLHLTPVPLLSSFRPGDDAPVPPPPAAPTTLPDLHLSPTSNYPAPHGTALLGETLRVGVCLRNVSDQGFTASPNLSRSGSGLVSPSRSAGSLASPPSGSTPPRRSGSGSAHGGGLAGIDVRGAKMMLEVQSPSARTRLGEAVHGGGRAEGTDPATLEERPWDVLPRLRPGEGVELDVAHDVVELGAHILIISVAWETEEGRRTFQRFLKFNVTAPLAIKTRVHLPSNANTALDAKRRGAVYLEVLMQNMSPQAMVFGDVSLLPMPGLEAGSLGSRSAEEVDSDDIPLSALSSRPPTPPLAEIDGPSLLPGDTTQRLFVLTPVLEESVVVDDPPGHLPLSSFPATYAAGTVLALGRLDIAWVSGAHREPGRFTTSTLNRRTPALPPTAPPSRPASVQLTVGGSASARNSLSQRPGAWEFDLTVAGERSAPVEAELNLSLRIGVRAPITTHPPPPLRIGVQLLTPAPAVLHPAPAVAVSVLPPSRTGTPQVRPSSPAPSISSTHGGHGSGHGHGPGRPFSPLSTNSRPMTPVTAQLRHAAAAHIGSPSPAPAPSPIPTTPLPPQPSTAFPPTPLLERPPVPLKQRLAGATLTPALGSVTLPIPVGRAVALGPTLVVPAPKEWTLVRERAGTNYAAETPSSNTNRWEALYDLPLSYVALGEGLVELGGVRVLLMDTEGVGREWETLGDVWVEA